MRRIGRSTMIGALLPLLTIWIVPASASTAATAPGNPETPEVQLWRNFQYDFPQETIVRFGELATKAEQNGDSDAQAVYLSQIARAEGIRENLGRAEEILDRAEALAERDGSMQRVRLERARILRRRGKTETARKHFTEIYETSSELDLHPNLPIDAAHMLAIMSDDDEADRWTARGLGIAEASEDPFVNRWVGVLAWNLARDYERRQEHAMAALYYARSLASRREFAGAPVLRTTEFALARQLRHLGACEEAIGIQTRLSAQQPERAEPLYEIAECHATRGESLEARAAARRALDLLGEGEAPETVLRRLESLAASPDE